MQKAKGQARISKSIKNKNKSTSILFILLMFIAIGSQTLSFAQPGERVVNIFCWLLIFCARLQRQEVARKASGLSRLLSPCISWSCRLPIAFQELNVFICRLLETNERKRAHRGGFQGLVAEGKWVGRYRSKGTNTHLQN